ncbi:hypothetical protein TrLO_g14775 [Triparma laevis f. longispina]|uniref:Uncharacterized protein n=1 Tax=Triparma laevis f. longispina TaxID=1714387 RepID=A0A9W7DRU1_9STRA|nr:hypothetical protein TrLO_g14775 [Triparma laevis f. longispina]
MGISLKLLATTFTLLAVVLFVTLSPRELLPNNIPLHTPQVHSNFSRFPPRLPSCLVRGGAFKGFFFSLGYLRGVERNLEKDEVTRKEILENLGNASPVHHANGTTYSGKSKISADLSNLDSNLSLFNDGISDGQVYPLLKPHFKPQSYHCYSGGCFAVVAHLMGMSFEDVVTIGLDLQRKWMDGKISRFDIVSKFIDEVLPTNPTTPLPSALKTQLHIITSTTAFQPHIQTPTTISETKKLLIQTSWIPGITGNSFFSDGEADGFLSSYKHPMFEDEVAEQDWDLAGFKISMTKEDAESAYNYGLELGRNNTHSIC